MPIESETKKQKVTEDVQRWCDHVHATPLLRVGDIEGLVSQILDEFYRIRLCCGHGVRDFGEGVHIAFWDNDGKSEGIYCTDCAERYQREMGAWEVRSAD